MTFDIVAALAALSSGLQIVNSVKELLGRAADDLEKSTDTDWCTYVNAFHGFKISWPSQRWSLTEQGIGNVWPNVYIPISIRSTIVFPVNLPNAFQPGQLYAAVPIIQAVIDLHGYLPMESYIQASVENRTKRYQSVNGHYVEEKLARAVDANLGKFAGKVIYAAGNDYPTSSIWEIVVVRRSGGRMFAVYGTMIENITNYDIVFEELMKIIETVSLLKR